MARRVRAIGILAALCGASAFAAPAPASTVIASFEGRVLGGSFEVPPEVVGLVAVGSRVHGTFRYETAALDSDATPTRGDYAQPPGLGIDITLGSAHVGTDPAATDFFVQVLDEHPLPGYSADPVDRLGLISRNSNSVLSPSSTPPNQLHIFFEAPWLTIGSDSLHEFVEALLAGEIRNGAGQVATTAGQLPTIFINFSVDSVRLIQTPEPSSIALLGFGLLCIGRRTSCRMPFRRPTADGSLTGPGS